MKKIAVLLLGLFLFQSICFAKDTIEFNFPNEGWHKVASPDGVQTKQCFVPFNQSSENYTEMLVFSERTLKNKDITSMSIIHKQLGKDRTNYPDIVPEYIKQNIDDAMVTWCSQLKNTCSVERAFKGNDGVILLFYINKMPHYSQNMFGQWSNILNTAKLYNPADKTAEHKNLIEL